MSFQDLDHVFREDYMQGALSEKDVEKDPLLQFESWFNDIVQTGVKQPNSMILSTVGKDLLPSSRVVLLKDVNDQGFVFFSNYTSSKAQAIEFNSLVSLLFFSIELERQIHIQGHVQKISYEESNAYFKSRPFKSQVAAMASHQSDTIASREVLENEFSRLNNEFSSTLPECPDYWGGYRLKPIHYEFWQGRPSRLHDRICYRFLEDKTWEIYRKAP